MCVHAALSSSAQPEPGSTCQCVWCQGKGVHLAAPPSSCEQTMLPDHSLHRLPSALGRLLWLTTLSNEGTALHPSLSCRQQMLGTHRMLPCPALPHQAASGLSRPSSWASLAFHTGGRHRDTQGAAQGGGIADSTGMNRDKHREQDGDKHRDVPRTATCHSRQYPLRTKVTFPN